MVPGCDYFLAKEQLVQNLTGKIEREKTVSSNLDKNALQVIFEIDGSNSRIQNEHILLAEYLNSSYLSIDLYDADTRFLYGTTKVPLQELLR